MFESVVVVPIHIYINVYIRVFSSLGILCDFISLALVINCFSIFLFFFYTKGERRPRGGNYLSILLLERLFSERSLIILIYEKLDRSVKSVRFAKKYLNNCSLAVFRRFEQTFVHYRVFLPWQLFDPPCPLFRRLNFRRTFIVARILFVFCNPDVGNFVKIDPTFSYVRARNETNFKIRENSIAGNKFYKFVSLFNLENKRASGLSVVSNGRNFIGFEKNLFS